MRAGSPCRHDRAPGRAPKASKRIVVVTDEPRQIRPARSLRRHRDVPSPRRPRSLSSASCARSRASRCCSTTRPARPRSGAAARRGTYPDPDKRVIINELVCEGCGDCGVQVELRARSSRSRPSSAASGDHRPVELQQGFLLPQRLLPVLRHGARRQDASKARASPARRDPLRRRAGTAAVPRSTATAAASIIDGVGGTGVVTIGAILGMAAHLEGKGCGMIDMAGLAQKGGAVFSHIRIARTPEDIHAIRVSAGKADLILGCDLVVSGARRCSPRCARTTRSSSPTRPRSCPASSPARPTIRCRSSG